MSSVDDEDPETTGWGWQFLLQIHNSRPLVRKTHIRSTSQAQGQTRCRQDDEAEEGCEGRGRRYKQART